MYKYGVCNYDMDAYNPLVKNLALADSYEDARKYYMDNMFIPNTYRIDPTLWIVWIEGNSIIQFEQLTTKVRTKIVDLDN